MVKGTTVIGLVGVLLLAESMDASDCSIASHHGGLAFPVERVATDWVCRLQMIIDDHTTADKVGPIRVALSETIYRYLLDRPQFAAALLNRLDLGLYKAEVKGSGRFWGDDGEGTRGVVELVYEDRTSRIYYLDGTHDSRLLANIAGKAVVFLRMEPVRDMDGSAGMDSTLIAYTRLDNRMLSGLVSLIRPLVGGIVTHKLRKGVESVDQLGHLMRESPELVLFEAMDPPALASENVVWLKEVLGGLGSQDAGEPRHP